MVAMDGKRIVSLDNFDDVRLDISKTLSPFFVVVHSFWIGTNSLPNGRNNNYNFVTQVSNETGKFF